MSPLDIAAEVAILLAIIGVIAQVEYLTVIVKKGEKTMADLTALIAQVKANTDAEAAAVQAMHGLAVALENAKGNQDQINDIVAHLKDSADALGKAIIANTPAEPAPPTEENAS